MDDDVQAQAARVDRANREHRLEASIGLVLCAIEILSPFVIVAWFVWVVSWCLR